MSLQVGEQVLHKQFGKGVITGVIDRTHVKAKFEEEEFEKIISPRLLAGYISIGDTILSLSPENIVPELLAYLFEVKNEVRIRVHYPKHVESFVFELFSREGIELPSNIRALYSGLRGGVTIQRTLAAEMWFPTPSFITISTPHTSVGGITTISRLEVILTVLKAGFSITNYTKSGTA